MRRTAPLHTLTLVSLAIALMAAGCASRVPTKVSRDGVGSGAVPEPAAASADPAPPAREIQPANLEPQKSHYQAARTQLLKGNTDEASLEVRLALQDNPLDAPSHFLLGCLLEQQGEHEEAIVAFQRALAIDPTNPDALYNLGTMLLWRGEAVPAARLLESAVLIRPDHVPYRNNLGKAYYMAKLPELAVASYEEALQRDPSNAIALRNLMILAEAAGFRDAAAAYGRRLKAIGSGRTARPGLDAGEPIAPTWPTAIAAAGSLEPIPLPVTIAPQAPVGPDEEADALRELLRDLPHVTVERRAGRLTLTGWTSGPREREMLDRILGKSVAILDLTSDDSGDPQRMIEIDAVLFTVSALDQRNEGFNFLNLIDINFNYFATGNQNNGIGFTAPPAVTGLVNGLSQQSWIFAAAASYSVNIANASKDRVAVLARPHLTALSGASASFLSGGELVYKVSGINSGDIKPYPFGVTLTVTPTLLRTQGEDGTPRIHMKVDVGRTSALSILNQDPDQPTVFQKLTVASEAVLGLGQTLILSGLSQRERQEGRSGVPGLMHIPILKYFFSTKTVVQSDAAVVILLTPRDAAFVDEQNRKALADFVETRIAYLKAMQGTEEDMRLFRERYPDWQEIAPNRFASQLVMMEKNEIYRTVAGQILGIEDVDLQLLGPKALKKRSP